MNNTEAAVWGGGGGVGLAAAEGTQGMGRHGSTHGTRPPVTRDGVIGSQRYTVHQPSAIAVSLSTW